MTVNGQAYLNLICQSVKKKKKRYILESVQQDFDSVPKVKSEAPKPGVLNPGSSQRIFPLLNAGIF